MNRNPRHISSRGFTIIEAMIVMGIIALLGSILLIAVGKIRKSGDVVAEQGMVSSLKLATQDFKNRYNFLPPLVLDGPQPPVSNSGLISVWTAIDLGDPTTSLNGSGMWPERNGYSEYSLTYYLAGVLDVKYDGVAGLGFTEPSRDGQFSRKGSKIAAIFDPSQHKTRTNAIRLYVPNPTSTNPQQRIGAKIWDRWSDGSTTTGLSKAIRYYRWLPTYWPQVAGDPNSGKIHYWNVPVAAGGELDQTMPPKKLDLRDAEYAVVSAGPDRLFGDEPGLSAADRMKAAADNIVEVGR